MPRAAPGCTGTNRDLPPLPERTLSVGVAVSSDRSRTSRSSASDTRRPARYCSGISSFAFGLGRCPDDGVHLVGFEVFGYALGALGVCAVFTLVGGETAVLELILENSSS